MRILSPAAPVLSAATSSNISRAGRRCACWTICAPASSTTSRRSKHEFIEASILDRDAVRKAVQDVDYVFHLAAMISVPESMAKPIECNEINTTGTLVVLEEAAKAGVKKLILSSSAAIYGDNPVVPKVETMLAEPKSPYAITKLDGEFYCKMFADEGRLPTACLRYFNVFGPRQDPQSQYAAAVPIFIDRAVKNLPITIYGDGEQTRDFIYVKDIVAANVFFRHAIQGHRRVQRGLRKKNHDQGTGAKNRRADRHRNRKSSTRRSGRAM